MQRSLVIPLFIFPLLLLMLSCFKTPGDPEKNTDNAAVTLYIDNMKLLRDTVYTDSIGDTVLLKATRILDDLIDSFSISIDEDSLMTFIPKEYPDDTIFIKQVYGTTGRRGLNITYYFTNGTSRTDDSVAIISIILKNLHFISFTPDSSYLYRDGDTMYIPLATSGGSGDTPQFSLGDTTLPDSGAAELITDSVSGEPHLHFIIPLNAAGNFSVRISAADSSDTCSADFQFSVTDSTAPLPPVFSSPSVVNTTTPTWNWLSGGNGGSGTFRYTLDNNTLTDGNSTETDSTSYTTPKSQSDGVHTLLVQERDSSGNWSKTASWSVQIDLDAPDAPEVRGISPTNSTKPTWTWSSSGAEEPLYRVRLDSAKFAPDSEALAATSYTPSEELTEGTHTLYVQERDDAGNWSVSGSFTITIDRTGPNAPTVKGSTPTSNRRPAWSWTVNGGGKGYFRCALDTADFGDNTFFTSALAYNAASDLDEGEHVLHVQEQDTSGNWSSSGSFSITIDVTPPPAPVISAPSASNSLQPEWSWTSGGGGSGTYRYKLDSDDLSTGATSNNATSFSPPTNLSEGPHTFFVQESDTTGNWSTIALKAIVIDTTAPETPNVNGSTLTNNKKPSWQWAPVSGGNGTFRYKIDAAAFSGETTVDTTAFTAADDLGEGDHWFFVQARDAAGNWSKSDSFRTTVDVTPPGAPLISGSAITNSLQPLWSWTSSGGGSGEFRHAMSAGDLAAGTVTAATYFQPASELTVEPPADTVTFYVQERDAAGNWSTAASFATVIDTSAPGAPNVTAVSPTNSAPHWIWASSEDGSGIFRFGFTPDTAASLTPDTTATQYTMSTGYDNDSSYILYVTEKDTTGNWSPFGLFVVKVDLVPPSPPSVSCTTPTNDETPTWSISSIDGNGRFRYKLDSNDFTSGATEISETSFTPSGALSAGTHTLYVQERDAAGNWSTLNAAATVIDLTPPPAPAPSVATPTNNQKPVWSWTLVSGGNGTFRCKVDSDDFSSGADAVNTTTYSPASSLSEGKHTLYLQASDAAGNWSETASKEVTIDLTPPGEPEVRGPAYATVTKPSWTWTAGGGGNGTYRYKLDDADLTTGSTGTSTTSFTPATALSEITHTLYVQERDTAGNWSATGSFAITIDISPPGTPVLVTAPAISASRILTWNWASGGSGNGKYRHNINGGSWSSDAAATTYTSKVLEEKANTFYVQERDEAGNWSASASAATYILPAPGNLSASNQMLLKSWQGVLLTWNDSATTNDSVYVYRVEPCPEGIKCLRILPAPIARLSGTATSYLDGDALSCTTYEYYVKAVKSGVGSTTSNTVSILARPSNLLCGIIIDPGLVLEPVLTP